LRIIHVTNYFPGTHTHVGGAEQACFRTAMLQREHGCSVCIVTTRPVPDAANDLPCLSVPIMEDYLPAPVRTYVEAAKWYSAQYDPLALRSFGKILKRVPAEFVHFHNCQFLTLSLISAAKQAGRKVIVSFYDYWLFCPNVMLLDGDKRFCARAHGPWCLDCLPKTFATFQKLLLSIRRRVIDRYLKLVDGFHVLSEHSRSVVHGYGIDKSKIHVAPLTLPLEFREVRASPQPIDPNMILFAGWRNERKGLHRLLEAMPHVLKEHPTAHLVAVGGTVRFGEEYEKLLAQLIEAGGLRDRVTFAGHVQPRDMQAYIERTAVVVIPEQYENMSPLLMIEAMSLAKPVVVSNVGGIPEFIEHSVNGWLADRLDAADFARWIIRTLKNPHESSELGRRARESILAKCADEKVWEKTLSMYQSLRA